MPPRPPSRWRRRLLALSLAGALSFVLLEIGTRLFVGAPLIERLPIMTMRANPVRGWQMAPGRSHYTYQHPVRVNSLGLRGREVEPKRPGEFRVLALGDSLTYGQGVGDDETLPATLEAELARRDPGTSWSVVNAGHRAYDTPQELALLGELGEAIQPDLVLLCWYWNDLHERDIAATYERLKDRGEVAFDTGNRVEGWDRVCWQSKQLVRHSALIMLLHDLLQSPGGPLDPDYVDRGFQRLGHYLEQLGTRSRALGARPVLVVFPDSNLLRGREDTRPLNERALALARERGIPALELLPALVPLTEELGHPPILPFDGHYDARANRAMGEYLARRLAELGLLAREG